MVTSLTSIATMMVAQTFIDVSDTILLGSSMETTQAQTQIFSIGIAAQSWTTGFLMGKILCGSFATGFHYEIILLAMSAGAAVLTREFDISPSALMSLPRGEPTTT